MKKILSKNQTYFFSIIPIIGICGVLTFGSTKNDKTFDKKPTKLIATSKPINPLPCGFPNGGIVGGDNPTFTPQGDPILKYPADGSLVSHPTPSEIGNAWTVLKLQSDGNLCLVTATQQGWKTTWDSGTNGSGADRLYFQNDGNLVLKKSSTGAVVWTSNISSSCANSELAYFVIQNDGNMVMRYPTGDGRAYALGDTGTASCNPTTQCGPHNTSHKHQIKN